jgi:hypothetical protein
MKLESFGKIEIVRRSKMSMKGSYIDLYAGSGGFLVGFVLPAYNVISASVRGVL